jgi:hypothetical protein
MLLDIVQPDGTVKLVICDFGLARIFDETVEHEVKGRRQVLVDGISYQYASLEALRLYKYGERADADTMAAIDVFAWALTAFHMLTQEYPWGTLGADAVEQALARRQRPMWTTQRPFDRDPLMRQLRLVVEAAWANDPYDRPAFVDLRANLGQVMRRVPV